MTSIRIGTRTSQLAMVQAEHVKSELERYHSGDKFDIHSMKTLGDNVLDKPLYTFGGKSLWTSELEAVLLDSSIDMIVHSLKDVPTTLPEEFEIAAILKREDPREALVMKAGSPYKSLKDLPKGAVVGTSSLRRIAQLKRAYPHLQFMSARGNLNTRLAKLDNPASEYSCLILAAAGLIRLGFKERITMYLESPELFYAVGQGALGIEIRKNDKNILSLLEPLVDIPTTYECIAERSLMRTLEGGCSIPIGVNCSYNNGMLTMKSTVTSVNGEEQVA
ncbi:hypothetical protein CANCADRAFT_30011, partial [Tortispora caseinolytica NRRL Y-17796]